MFPPLLINTIDRACQPVVTKRKGNRKATMKAESTPHSLAILPPTFFVSKIVMSSVTLFVYVTTSFTLTNH
jgi:hypothetical protein